MLHKVLVTIINNNQQCLFFKVKKISNDAYYVYRYCQQKIHTYICIFLLISLYNTYLY